MKDYAREQRQQALQRPLRLALGRLADRFLVRPKARFRVVLRSDGMAYVEPILK